MNNIRLKLAAYASSITMAVVSSLSPLLFLTFHILYGISYTKLGFLVFIGFTTQLLVDLIFSFFSHKFTIPTVLRTMPILAVVGLFIMAASPYVFKEYVYSGLILGTIIFSASAGLSEVLTSPLIASLPADNPDREMSKLHSVYAFGVVFVVMVTTLYLEFLPRESWVFLPIIFSVIPIFGSILFFSSNIPNLKGEKKEEKRGNSLLKSKTLWIFVVAIFLGGAAECNMSQWVSSYLEVSLEIPKTIGDIFGVALFSLFLGIGRMLYARIGKNIERVLLISAIFTTVSYITAAISPFSVLGLLACAMTGFTTAMLWPGNLIAAEKRLPDGGVVMFALLAAGGDLGASLGPQITGIITDSEKGSTILMSLAEGLSISAEQLGMRIGILVGALFPLVAIPIFIFLLRSNKKRN